MRDPKKFTIEEVLNTSSQLQVPAYQRSYDWKADAQARDLFSDLLACIGASHNRELFLGTTIFDVSTEREDVLQVIDGQQRLTTILIILIALRQYARQDLENDETARDIQDFIGKRVQFRKEYANRLLASPSIQDVFSRMCDLEWDGKFPDTIEVGNKKKPVKRQNSRVQPIYDYAYNEVKEFCAGSPTPKLLEFVEQLLRRSYIIRIDIEDEEEAFEIFERTNARGKPLEISDLLKNFLFSKQSQFSSFNIQDGWDDVTRNAGSSILRMLKYFWVARKGHTATRDLYRNIRTYAANEVGVEKFFNELIDFSEFYAAYTSNDRATFGNWLHREGYSNEKAYQIEATRCVGSFRTFGVTQAIPVVFSATHSFVRDESQTNPKKLLSLFRLLESYHFINNKVCNRVGNEVERLYAKVSEQFFNESFGVIAESLEKELLLRLADKDEFIANFHRITYDNLSDRPTIRYIFDRILNKGTKPGQSLGFVDFFDDVNKVRSEFDIEHLLSQSLVSEDNEVVHEMGNLMIIPRQINGILGNDDFPTKMAQLQDPNRYANNIKHVPDYIKDFINKYGKTGVWADKEIQARTKDLAGECYQISAEGYRYK